MRKKKVLFVIPSLFLGGAERSLIGLLENFDYSRYEVFLFLYRHEGELLNDVPRQVQILPEVKEYRTFDIPIINLVKIDSLAFLRSRIKAKVKSTLFAIKHHSKQDVWFQLQNISRCLQPKLPAISGEYDLGIMFSGYPDTLVNKVNAKVKMSWFHTDYDQIIPDEKYDLETYGGIDWIVGVSESCSKIIKRKYPTISDKVITIENILGEINIRIRAEQRVSDMNIATGEIALLSIGRFCEAKNFENIPEINSILRKKGWRTKWFIIGFGSEENLIKENIRKYDVKDSVIILGKRDNPYPYIKLCDYYIQPSRYEGKCVSIREAQILNKPVIITNYQSAPDQLNDGIDGIIISMDTKKCAEEISKILSDSSLKNRLVTNCSKGDFTNKNEANKIYKLIIE